MYIGQIPAQIFLEEAILVLSVRKCKCPHTQLFNGHHAYHF